VETSFAAPTAPSRRFAATQDAAFVSGCFGSKFKYYPANRLSAPQDILSLGGIAAVVMTRPGTYTGSFFSLYAEAFRPLRPRDLRDRRDELVRDLPVISVDSPRSFMTEVPSGTRFLRATRVNGHWSTELLEAKKITAGDFLVCMTPLTPALRPLAVKVDVGDRMLNAIVARVTSVSSKPCLRAPVVEVGYTSTTPLLCDGLAVNPPG